MDLDTPENQADNSIYDIYVIKSSGLPLFAGCTVSEYCKNHMGQHELISGFFSALLSFSEESFNDDNLETILYQDIQLNFRKDEEKDLIFVFINDREANVNIIRSHLQSAHELFVNEYEEYIDKFTINQSNFDNFRGLLCEKGIVQQNLKDTSGMMKITDQNVDESPRLVKWLKSIFSTT